MLNSHWGKFGQQANKVKMTYVSEPQKYVEMMTDNKIEVTDLIYVNKEHIGIRWKSKDDFVEAFDGNGRSAKCKIVQITKKNCQLERISGLSSAVIPKRVLTAVIPFIKKNNFIKLSIGKKKHYKIVI